MIGFNPRSREGNDIRWGTPNGSISCFNPRSREGNDLVSNSLRLPESLFQSTFPRRERRMVFPDLLFSGGFNPRSREGNDNEILAYQVRKKGFQSTFPRRERHSCRNASKARPEFQSTFPRRERLQSQGGCCTSRSVSIHVPAKGTTSDCVLFILLVYRVSIHVPAKGTTTTGSLHRAEYISFNPRSREGNDDYVPQLAFIDFSVSIHVPAKGTTPATMRAARNQSCFNPRSREGNDPGRHANNHGLPVSIHVPAKGTTTADN